MNPISFSPLTRRFLAIALPALICLVAILFIIAPILSVETDLRSENGQKRQTLRRYTNAVADLPNLEAAVAQAKEAGNTQTVAIAPSVAIAAARLQTTMRAHVSAKSGKTSSIESLESRSVGQLSRAGVRVQGTVPASEFPKLLHAIESDPARLVVGDVTVASRNAQIGRGDAQGRHDVIFMLSVYQFFEVGEGS